MRRDLDLVRKILFEIESTAANREPGKIAVEGYDEDAIIEHIEDLHERRYIEAIFARAGSGDQRMVAASVRRMLPDGRDFLDNARNETTWKRTKEALKDHAGSASLDVVKGILLKITKETFGLG